MHLNKKNNRYVITAEIIFTLAIMAASNIATPEAFAQQPEPETDPQDMQAAVQQTQQISTQHVTTEQQQVNGLQFVPRWGPIIDIDSNRLMVLFANCETGEFAVSGQHIFTSAELEALQSFAIGLPDNLMSWLVVVENEGTELAPASVGVICTDESGAVDGVDLDISTKTTINNVVNQFIRVAGGQIINLGQIINIYQNITQVAYQYVNITGNNNTVNQIINQSASQIVAANGTNIGQIINQTATQVAGPQAVEAPPTTNATETTPSEEEQQQQQQGPISQLNATDPEDVPDRGGRTNVEDRPLVTVPPSETTEEETTEEEEVTEEEEEEEEETTTNAAEEEEEGEEAE